MKKSLLFSVTLILLACQNKSEKELSVDNQIIKPTFEIAPPIDEFKPQTELFSIDNSKDTILISDHGSFIHVPANSFVDKNGEPVTDVEVEFTEFTNPADILLSGIPMEYITEDGNEVFQSAGMCEIGATSNGKEVAIADGKSLDIGLKNQAQDSDYNLYFFDKQKGEWIEKEKALAVDNSVIPTQPVTISTIDTSRILNVDVQENSLNMDFKMWDQSNFYLLPGQDPKYYDQGVYWYNMEVIKTTNPDIFVLKFLGTSGGEQVVEALKVQPLVSAGNHDKAMREFNNKMRKHAKRLIKNKKEKEELLDADNTVAQIVEEHEEMKEQVRVADSIRIADSYAASEVRNNVMRTFQVNQLGLYNCDRFYIRAILATKSISFKNEGKALDFNYTYLCSPRDNAVLNYLIVTDGTYKLDISSGKFYFIGIKGKDIFCKEINVNTTNGTHEIEQIDKEVLDDLMI
jgi:hypothetical protein